MIKFRKKEKNEKNNSEKGKNMDEILKDNQPQANEMIEKVEELNVISSTEEQKADELKTEETISQERQTEEKNDQSGELEKFKQQYQELSDKYLRLSAEFDNYRKRTLKERMELTKYAGEETLLNILPVIDNFERGLKSLNETTDIEAVKEGFRLIYTKFKEFLNQRGVKEIEAMNQEFNLDLHEAITKIPAPAEDLKGKVVDVIEKGYYLYDKVVRFSKVVIGE